MIPYVMRPRVPRLASGWYTFHMLALAPIHEIRATQLLQEQRPFGELASARYSVGTYTYRVIDVSGADCKRATCHVGTVEAELDSSGSNENDLSIYSLCRARRCRRV